MSETVAINLIGFAAVLLLYALAVGIDEVEPGPLVVIVTVLVIGVIGLATA